MATGSSDASFVTLRVSASWSLPPLPSSTLSVTSNTLSALASLGASKSAALVKVKAPLALSILKALWSAPPLMLKLSVSALSASVAVAV